MDHQEKFLAYFAERPRTAQEAKLALDLPIGWRQVDELCSQLVLAGALSRTRKHTYVRRGTGAEGRELARMRRQSW